MNSVPDDIKELRALAMTLFEQIPDDFTSEQRREVIRAMSDLCDLWEKWDAEDQNMIKKGPSSS